MYTRNTWITEPREAEVKIEEGKEADREKKICILKNNNKDSQKAA